MNLFEKILEIYQKYYLCPHCLGRMFSLLGTSTTNHERGRSLLLSLTMENHRNYLSNKIDQDNSISNLKILAQRAYFLPAQKILEKEGFGSFEHLSSIQCFLCHNIYDDLKKFAINAKKVIEDYEFKTFIIGTSLDPKIINKEDKFKAEFNLLESESFKNHFNREVGKILTNLLNKPPEFSNPDITIIFNLDYESYTIDLIVRSIFIYGKYNKLIRGIPQTHWDCKNCRGKGCTICNFTGKQYPSSIEELISFEFIKESNAEGSKFHGAGREDIDVKMLGEGRPFIIELKNPKKRTLNLNRIQKIVNKINKRKVKISELRYSTKNFVKKIKFDAESTKKTYLASVTSSKKISKEEFKEFASNLKKKLENQKIQQKTPQRVVHRRADKVREKFIYNIDGKFIKSNLFTFIIETQGGTYIKELIHGDNGRTSPSFTEILGFPLTCKQLDVIKIN